MHRSRCVSVMKWLAMLLAVNISLNAKPARAYALSHNSALSTMKTRHVQSIRSELRDNQVDTELLAKLMIVVSGSMLLTNFSTEDIAFFISGMTKSK